MQLEALKVFCDLVDLRNFSKAAKANGVSQPTATRVVHQLENRLGGRLVDRSKRPLQLTALGQAYYEGCKKLVEQYLALETSLRQTNGQLTVTVRVAAIYSVGLGDMGCCIGRFEAQHPHAKVQLEYLHPDQVSQKVLDGSADLGLLSFPGRTKELTVLPWRDEEMVVACAPGHPLADCPSVLPGRLDGEKFVAFDKGLVIRREVDRFLREHGAVPEVVLEFDNIETIKKGVEIGAGLALLPEPTLRQELQRGTLRAVRLEGCRLVRPLRIIHRRQPQLGNAALAFIEQLRTAGVGPPSSQERNGAHGETRPRTTGNSAAPGTAHARRKKMVT
jgi:DNA-binding transcriptional LysR family regulator